MFYQLIRVIDSAAKPLLYKTVTLKNGQSVFLSWLEEDDLPEVAEALNSVVREEKYLLMDKEITDVQSERMWFWENKETGMRYFVARVNGKVIGGASLTPFTGKRAHIAELGIYIIKNQRNLGLGTILTKELIEVAQKSKFEIIQLSALSNNKRGCTFTENAASKNAEN